MTWTYPSIDSTDFVKDSRADVLARDEALRASFIGTSFPASPTEGQLCFRSDTGYVYVCIDATTPVWEVVNIAYFLALAGGTLTGLLKLAKGAAKASAATVNLSTRTGNFIHITGTTGISAFTLDAGDWALVTFDAALDITLSASLLGPPTLNTGTVSIAANDMALLVGDGSGVTRIVQIFRISGNAVNDSRYALADGSRAFTAAPRVGSEGRLLHAASGVAANSGRVSWGTGAPGTLDEGEIYLKYT